MDTNVAAQALTEVGTTLLKQLLGSVWDVIRPHLVSLSTPTLGIMAFIAGFKLFAQPWAKNWSKEFKEKFYRIMALALGPTWLIVAPMIPMLKEEPHAWPMIVFVGLFLGLFNILAYHWPVAPFFGWVITKWKSVFSKKKE